MTAPSRQVTLPRGLIFLASIWLIASWILAIGIRHPVHPSSASYEPGVRLMLLCLTTGLMVGWPLLRLSQTVSLHPLRETLLDLAVLLSMVQIVLWPLRLVTTWSVSRTAAIDATLAGWMFLFGATIASAIGIPRRGPRHLAMLACVAMCLLGPALAVAGMFSGVDAMALIELSPLMAVRSVGDGGAAPVTLDQWRWIALLLVAGAAVWIALGLWTVLRSPRGGAGEEA